MKAALSSGVLLFAGGLCFAQDIEYRTVALRGDAAPGTDPGTTFFSFEDPMIDDDGNTAFVATLFGTGVTSDNQRGLWVERDGVLTLVAREGFQAPGQPSGVVFDWIISPVMNRNGNTAFRAWLEGPGIDFSNRDSIWSETDGPGLGLVVQGAHPQELAAWTLVVSNRSCSVITIS